MTIATAPTGTRVRIKADAHPAEYGPNAMMGLAFLVGMAPGQENFVQDDQGRYTGVIGEYPNQDVLNRIHDGDDEEVPSAEEYAAKAREHGLVPFVIDGTVDDPDDVAAFPFYADALEFIEDDTTPAPATGIAATNAALRGDAA